MRKKQLLVIIDNLKKGGAEVLLVGTLPALNDRYDVTLVTLTDGSDFAEEQIKCRQHFVLGFYGKLSFVKCVWKLKKIIRNTAPDIIHAHLFYSSLAARLACPSSIPLVYSVHNELSKNIFNHNPLYHFLEKKTIRKNHSIIAVSEVVLRDYTAAIQLPIKSYILRNYVADSFFEANVIKKDFDNYKELKMLAVGNVKHSKNYKYLVRSFVELKDLPVSLDVYGDHSNVIFGELKKLIEDHKLPIQFKGKVSNVREVFLNYDIYVMSSKYEGFGIAAIEAMSQGLPVMLSDIPVLREVTSDTALFFDINNPSALADLIKGVLAGKQDLNDLASKGMVLAKQYTLKRYISELSAIYDSLRN